MKILLKTKAIFLNENKEEVLPHFSGYYSQTGMKTDPNGLIEMGTNQITQCSRGKKIHSKGRMNFHQII